MKTERFVIGIEIDRIRVRASLADERLRLLDKVESSIDSVKTIGTKCSSLIEELIRKSGRRYEDIDGIGLSAGSKFAHLEKTIGNKLKIKTFYNDTASCALLGEISRDPEAAGFENILYVYSDLGACALLKNRNLATWPEEISAYLKPWDDSLGLAAIAKREVERGVGTNIVEACEGRIDRIDDASVLKAAAGNDEVAVNIVHSVGVTLGMRIAYLVNLTGPQVVILDANFEKAGDLLIGPIRDIVKKLTLKSRSEFLNIMTGKLGEDAVTLGAASLAIQKISR